MADYKLYERIGKIINSKSNEEASKLLFGLNGLDIDTKEWYQKMITSFTMKKENVILKKGNMIFFDIEENAKEIWNIIFLGKIIENYSSNLNYDQLERVVDQVRLSNYEGKPVDFFAIKELKKSIRIIQKLKDSLKHNKDNLSYNVNSEKQSIIICNPDGSFKLEVEIPLGYLEGFNKGEIIPLEEDKEIANETNNIAFPLMKALDYDTEKITDFFYRFNPKTISEILKYCNNDLREFYQLPFDFFSYYDITVKRLIDKYGFDVVKRIPSKILLQSRWSIYLVDKYGIDVVSRLPNAFVKCEVFDDYLSEYGIEVVSKISPFMFGRPETKKLIRNYGIEVVSKITFPEDCPSFFYEKVNLTRELIKKYGIDHVLEIPSAFFNNTSTLDKLLYKYGYDNIMKFKYSAVSISEIDNLINEFGLEKAIILSEVSPNKLKKVKELFINNNIDEKNGKELVLHLNWWLSNEDIQLLDDFISRYGVGIIPRLPIYIDTDFKTIVKIVNEYGIDDGLDFPIWVYSNYELAKKRINEYGIEMVKELPDYAYKNINSVMKIVDTFGLENTCDFSSMIFEKYDIIEKVIQDYSKEKALQFLKNIDFLYTEEMIDDSLNSLNLFLRLNEIKGEMKEYHIDNYYDLPIDHFRTTNYDLLYEIIKKYGYEEACKIDGFSYLRMANGNIDNISELLKRVDYNWNRLDEFPFDLFKCDIDALNEKLIQYDNNTTKSIFGMDNPKCISLIIYMDKVLSEYDAFSIQNDNEMKNRLINIDLSLLKDNSGIKELLDKEMVDKDNAFKTIVGNIAPNFYKKSEIEQSIYLDSLKKKCYIAYEDDIKDKLSSSINNDFIRHLRNAISHFRFRPVDDNCLILYDENENGDVCFEKTFNIKELFELTHSIERFLNNDLGDKSKDLLDISSELGSGKTNKIVLTELLTIINSEKAANESLKNQNKRKH